MNEMGYASVRPPPASVLGLYTMANMNTLYRIITPMRAIRGSWARIDRVEPDQLEAAETVIIHAIGGRSRDVRSAITSLRSKWGIRRILVDYDDAMLIPHPVKQVRIRPFQERGIREALKLVDGVIVTNEFCQEHFTQHTDKPIAVIPNLIWPADWPAAPPPAEHPPVIVLAGSPSHAQDWSLVVPALAQIRKQLPDVQFRLLGYGHPLLKQIATQGGGGWKGGGEYIQALAGGAIGLCPLPPTDFNLGKSPIKAMEYSLAAGMAVVGSPTQYADLLDHGRGYVAQDGLRLAWELAIGTYLVDPERRAADAQRLRSHILTHYDARLHTAHLEAVYYAMEAVV